MKGTTTMKERLAPSNGGLVASQTQATIRLFGMTAAIKAASTETGGAFCAVESTLPPHYRMVLPHWHAYKTEAFYVLDGALTFTRDDQTFIAQRGSFVLVPPRIVHVYWNSTAAPVTVLTFSTPGGLDCFLAELAKIFAEQPYDATLAAEIATRYDQFSPV
jgi:quercetin dioxygenase-like cupin family protein